MKVDLPVLSRNGYERFDAQRNGLFYVQLHDLYVVSFTNGHIDGPARPLDQLRELASYIRRGYSLNDEMAAEWRVIEDNVRRIAVARAPELSPVSVPEWGDPPEFVKMHRRFEKLKAEKVEREAFYRQIGIDHATRDRRIYRERLDGATYRAIGERYRICAQNARQIFQRMKRRSGEDAFEWASKFSRGFVIDMGGQDGLWRTWTPESFYAELQHESRGEAWEPTSASAARSSQPSRR
ncbi:MAG: hypothetical protein P4L76_17780 [Beijerinckiaceae bacterium]|nr:hypothetical protein [Beijerinckiaceae bacterium]